jgi:transcriptional regulator with XRE-family HTH domain
MQLSEQITEIIKQRLRQMHLNNADFAALMGSSPPMVTKWLEGKHNFTLDTLDRMQDVLGINFFDANIAKNNIPCVPCITKNVTPV